MFFEVWALVFQRSGMFSLRSKSAGPEDRPCCRLAVNIRSTAHVKIIPHTHVTNIPHASQIYCTLIEIEKTNSVCFLSAPAFCPSHAACCWCWYLVLAALPTLCILLVSTRSGTVCLRVWGTFCGGLGTVCFDARALFVGGVCFFLCYVRRPPGTPDLPRLRFP